MSGASPAGTPPASEFSRMIDARAIDAAPVRLVAGAEECAALARRFEIVAVTAANATVDLVREGSAVTAHGRLVADILQSCAVSGEDFPVHIDERLAFRFVPDTATHAPDEELEIDAGDCDEIPFDGHHFDLGEAVAQSLGLAIDPFATGPDAEKVRASGLLGDKPVSPFAVLAGLKAKKD